MSLSFESLFRYDHWANTECLESLRALGTPPARAVALFAHMAGTKQNLLARAKGETPPCPHFPEWGIDESANVIDEADKQWKAYLLSLDAGALASEVEFDSAAMGGRQRIGREVLIQTALLHGAYHRGQIAALVREAGGKPPTTDLIIAPEIGAQRVSD
ncbi:MAG: hypothetical protein PWP23_1570 [Candidatus Sumerlaeota bacterium]|nr:hypothetical protein [Candidatus Sumerlaeota bacterium]